MRESLAHAENGEIGGIAGVQVDWNDSKDLAVFVCAYSRRTICL